MGGDGYVNQFDYGNHFTVYTNIRTQCCTPQVDTTFYVKNKRINIKIEIAMKDFYTETRH